MMLDSYMESSYYQGRFPKQEDFKNFFEQIGKNIVEFMKTLPEKSPMRKPLIKAISENVPLVRLREVLPVSKQTVINSKKLPDQENLLLTIRYKPNVRNRENDHLDTNGLDDSLDSELDNVDLSIVPLPVDSSSQDIIQTGEITHIQVVTPFSQTIHSQHTLPSLSHMQLPSVVNQNHM